MQSRLKPTTLFSSSPSSSPLAKGWEVLKLIWPSSKSISKLPTSIPKLMRVNNSAQATRRYFGHRWGKIESIKHTSFSSEGERIIFHCPLSPLIRERTSWFFSSNSKFHSLARNSSSTFSIASAIRFSFLTETQTAESPSSRPLSHMGYDNG